MILPMLSPTSLAAFSAGIQSLHPAPVQRTRVPGTGPPGAGAALPPPATQAGPPRGGGDGTAQPTRLLPRGSLLDLTV